MGLPTRFLLLRIDGHREGESLPVKRSFRFEWNEVAISLDKVPSLFSESRLSQSKEQGITWNTYILYV